MVVDIRFVVNSINRLNRCYETFDDLQKDIDNLLFELQCDYNWPDVEIIEAQLDVTREEITREEIMQQWDRWRAYIADGGKASWPRDAFESLLDRHEEEISDLKRQIDVLGGLRER